MDTKQEKFKAFMDDKNNWRPPSYTQIMKHVGWKSKNSVRKALEKLKDKYEHQRII